MTALGVIASGYKAPTGFDPLSIPWFTAMWANDPAVTPPADGATITSWNNPGTTTDANKGWTATLTDKPWWSNTGFPGPAAGPAAIFCGKGSTSARRLMCTHSAAVYKGIYTLVVVARITADESADNLFVGNPGFMRSGTSDATNTWRQRESVSSNQQDLAAPTSTSPRNANPQLLLVHRTAVAGQTDYMQVNGVQRATFTSVGAQDGWTQSVVGSAKTGSYVAFYAWIKRALTAQEQADLLAWSRSFYGTP